ncbi:ANTAR domain-containing protein [Gordonia sp. TBRC 11910]|uniref:ANTAR domain-containing protein n=1 Tax=Gordonia asplenii TaxID=2725283 RepID=A0A848L818_9ACTN|nr:PAS and ANTAR domain-containing protein [Gordonia asplenii]NMO04621.1 ANTAR domain-containing protein [Gordonia asplenii]
MTLGTEPTSNGGFRTGRFMYFAEGDRWEWSDELARIHGYESAAAVSLSTELLLRHKHPDDRARVADLIHRVRFGREPFSGKHRIVDVNGAIVQVIVVADTMTDGDAVIGTSGYYISLDEPPLIGDVDEIFDRRMLIEQAKGVIRFIYQLDDQRAFDLLVWRSQETNTKIRDLASALCDAFSTVTPSSETRARFDHLLLTAHEACGPDD